MSTNSFYIRFLSFDHGTDSMNEFVPDVVDDEHFVFPFFDFSQKVGSDVRVMINRSQGGHMQVFFKRPVCHRMDSGLPVYRFSRGIFKRHYTAITGKLFRIVISGKEVGKYGKVKCSDLSDSSNGSHQSNGLIELIIRKHQFFNFSFNTVNFVIKVFVNFFKVAFGKLSKLRREQFQFIGVLVHVRSGIDELSSDLEQYLHLFEYFRHWPVKLKLFMVFRGVYGDTFGIYPIALTSDNTYALGNLYGHFHTKAGLFFDKFGNKDFSIDTRMFHAYKRVGQRNLLVFKKSDKGIGTFSGVFEYIRGSPVIINDGHVEEPFRQVDTDKEFKVLFVHNE